MEHPVKKNNIREKEKNEEEGKNCDFAQLNKVVAVRWTATIMVERFCEEEMHPTMNMAQPESCFKRP